MKKSYVKPQVVDHGTIEKLTLGAGKGASLDVTFAVGTPVNLLTFS